MKTNLITTILFSIALIFLCGCTAIKPYSRPLKCDISESANKTLVTAHTHDEMASKGNEQLVAAEKFDKASTELRSAEKSKKKAEEDLTAAKDAVKKAEETLTVAQNAAEIAEEELTAAKDAVKKAEETLTVAQNAAETAEKEQTAAQKKVKNSEELTAAQNAVEQAEKEQTAAQNAVENAEENREQKKRNLKAKRRRQEATEMTYAELEKANKCYKKLMASEYPIAKHKELELDRGNIAVQVMRIQELSTKNKVLDLNDLLNAERIFKHTLESRQTRRASDKAKQRALSALLGTDELIPTERNETTAADTTDNYGEKGELSDSKVATQQKSESKYERDRLDNANLKNRLAGKSNDLDATAPAYHDLLYATANTLLGGRALVNQYDFTGIPKDWNIYVAPTVFSVIPGRVTRDNYSAQATLSINKDAFEDFYILGVAPAGFSSILSDTASDFKSFQTSLGAIAQIGNIHANGQYKQLSERLDRIRAITRRADFSVRINGETDVIFRALGSPTLSGGTELAERHYSVELIIAAKRDPQTEESSTENEKPSIQQNTIRISPRMARTLAFSEPDASRISEDQMSSMGAPSKILTHYSVFSEFQPEYTYNKTYKILWLISYTRNISAAKLDSNQRNIQIAPSVKMLPIFFREQINQVIIDSAEAFASFRKIRIEGKNLASTRISALISSNKTELVSNEKARDENVLIFDTEEKFSSGEIIDLGIIQGTTANPRDFICLQIKAKSLKKKPTVKKQELSVTKINAVLSEAEIAVNIECLSNLKAAPYVMINGSPASVSRHTTVEQKSDKSDLKFLHKIICTRAAHWSNDSRPKNVLITLTDSDNQILYSKPIEF